MIATVASAAQGYPFVPPSWAPSVFVPLTGESGLHAYWFRPMHVRGTLPACVLKTKHLEAVKRGVGGCCGGSKRLIASACPR